MLCHKYADDIFKMRDDKKKDFYFLMNENKEENSVEKKAKSERSESKSTRKGSSFIFGNSKKSEKIIQRAADDYENCFNQNPKQEEITEPEVKIIINTNILESKNNDNTTFNSTNNEVKMESSKNFGNELEEEVKKFLFVKEEKIVKSESFKPKIENDQVDIDYFKKKDQKFINENQKGLEKKPPIGKTIDTKISNNSNNQTKVKNSILTHWEARTHSFEKTQEVDETIKNISIMKDDINPSNVVYFFQQIYSFLSIV